MTLYASGIHIPLNTTISCLISVLAYGLAALPQTVAVAGLCIQEKRYLYVYRIMIKRDIKIDQPWNSLDIRIRVHRRKTRFRGVVIRFSWNSQNFQFDVYVTLTDCKFKITSKLNLFSTANIRFQI